MKQLIILLLIIPFVYSDCDAISFYSAGSRAVLEWNETDCSPNCFAGYKAEVMLPGAGTLSADLPKDSPKVEWDLSGKISVVLTDGNETCVKSLENNMITGNAIAEKAKLNLPFVLLLLALLLVNALLVVYLNKIE
jgi:hypothetical protein